MDKKFLIEHLTLFDKASLLVGYANMKTRPIESFEIPPLVMSDGPNGVRKENDGKDALGNSIHTLPTTCFPSGSTFANSWDNDLLHKVGKQIALECRYYGINALLGPAINIKRNPLCGRNFEYYSEDPLLSGYLAGSFIKGVQEEKVISCIKHYACNNLEKWRYVGDSIVDLRALNDIYLKSFEIAIREGHPGMVMTSYNQINGTFASENFYLLKDRLRNKFKFDGLTVTDWGGMVRRDVSLTVGQDLEMPGMIKENIERIVDAVNNKFINMTDVDTAVEHLLTAIENTRVEQLKDESIFDQSILVAEEAAIRGAVLLKNENDILPLNKEKKYLVIGDLFENMRFQGSGSALINAKRVINNKLAFDEYGVNYESVRGYNQHNPSINLILENEAINKAKDADEIIFFGGLTDLSESEGYDRDDMKLEANQEHLLTRLAELNKKIIFILYGGSPVEIPCYDNIEAILFMNLPGQEGGHALTKLLFGEISPSGHLSETWPIKYEDTPYALEFNSSLNELYKESIYVGYRYFSSAKKQVRFPFGYGLTYGKYHYQNLKAKVDDDVINVSFEAVNDSDIEIDVVPQIYVSKVDSNIPRPIKELKTYARRNLKGKDRQIVNLSIKVADLAVYDIKSGNDVVEDGEYLIYLSDHVNKDYENVSVNIKGEKLERLNSIYFDIDNIEHITNEQFEEVIGRKIKEHVPAKRPYTLETPIFEFKTFFGKIVRKVMIHQGDKIIRQAKKIKNEQERARQIKSGMFVKKMITVNCLRSLCFAASGTLPLRKAEGILHLVNGHIFRALKKLL